MNYRARRAGPLNLVVRPHGVPPTLAYADSMASTYVHAVLEAFAKHCAILRIISRSSIGIGGRPGRDFIRQSNLQPARCQRIIVAS